MMIIIGLIIALLVIVVVVNAIQQHKEKIEKERRSRAAKQKAIINETEDLILNLANIPSSPALSEILYKRSLNAIKAMKEIMPETKNINGRIKEYESRYNAAKELAANHTPQEEHFTLPENEQHLVSILQVIKKVRATLKSEQSKGALDAAIQDNLNEIAFDEFTNAYNRYLSSLSEYDRQKIRRLFHDSSYRESLFSLSRDVLSDELKALDIVHRVQGLSANVFLLHGASDNVIPCAQSERLFQELKGLKKKAELVVTPFISHGDTRFRLSQVPDIAKIVQGFASYFRSVSSIRS